MDVADSTVTVVMDRYRLLELVGVGGMGRVWRAHDGLLDRTVAVKELVLPPDMSPAEHRAAQGRVVREARAAARLDHPQVVRVFDVIRETGRSWIVMEYVAARSLHDVVAQDGPLGHCDAARVGLGVLAGLRAAHLAGVLHRDVKPHNVLIGGDGRVVLTDFGLATFAHPAAGAGDGGQVLGSPYYVAPERLRDATSTTRGDLWSLGATLYTAVEGRPPFVRETVADSLAAVLSQPPHPPRRPGPLHAVIAGLLAKDASARPEAAALHAALSVVAARAVGVSQVPAPRRPSGEAPYGPVVPAQRVGSEGRTPDRAWRRLRVAALAGGVLATAVLGGAVAAHERSAPTAPPVAPAAPVVECAGASPEPITGPAAPGPYALPDGWQWHRDPAGFRVAVPRGWQRSAVGSSVCFRDPDGTRTFTVDTAAPSTRQPLRYWQDAERAALADGSLPGYTRVSMGVLLQQRGGGDWEYTYAPPVGPARHVRRCLLTVDSGRAYLMRWTTREQDWALDVATQRRLVGSVG